jgi:ribosomal protein S18 acetylase RimI-like enzyme
VTTTARALSLRPVTTADRPFLLHLYGETRAAELALTGWSDEQRQAFVEMQFTAQDTDYRARFPHASFDVVCSDGTAVGRLYVDRRPDSIHVLDILIAAQLRGTGIGTALLLVLRDEARATGRGVSLYVETSNPARAWYERMGFVASGEAQSIYVLMRWAPP